MQPSGTAEHFFSVYFADVTTGWAVGEAGTIRKTTDGGNTWNAQIIGTAKSLESVYFTDATTGWVVGVAGTIFKTTDGGGEQ